MMRIDIVVHPENNNNRQRRRNNNMPPNPRHSAMYNSLRAEQDNLINEQETTPLVRNPPPHRPYFSVGSIAALVVLILIFITGVAISTYLMYLQGSVPQYESEGAVVDPDDTSIILIHRNEWAKVVVLPLKPVDYTSKPVQHIIIVPTGGPTCDNIDECAQLLNTMQETSGTTMLVNFLISSNGATFEALGWDAPSPMFPHLPALVVAFIGNFSEEGPSTSQMEEAYNLFDASIVKGYLEKDFTIVGKIVKSDQIPTHLFDSFQNLPMWDQVLSDEY